jgi:hypothetical protein
MPEAADITDEGAKMEPAAVSPLPEFRWPVAVSRMIAAPSSKVWEVISSPGALPLYHPFCEKNPVFEWPGPGSRDEVYYFSGWVFERRIVNWIDDVGFDLEIGRPDGRVSFVSWRIIPQDERRSCISIIIYPHGLQHLPRVVRWAPHLLFLRPRLKQYLRAVANGLDWFITNGQPVRRNQFGAHPWFSRAILVGPESHT